MKEKRRYKKYDKNMYQEVGGNANQVGEVREGEADEELNLYLREEG